MTTTPHSGGTPGTLTAYVHHKCRCPKCVTRMATWSSRRRRQRGYGTWQPTTPAAPARERLEAYIAAGLTQRQLANRTGVHQAVISNILLGTTQKLRLHNAAAILALPTPTDVIVEAAGRQIDATATRRRLQALAACGWPIRELARRLGVDQAHVAAIIHGRLQYLAGPTVAKIAALYDQLWDLPPQDAGVRAGNVRLALAAAARHRWAPPLAWDDDTIANPDAVPDWTGRCGTPGGYYDHSQLGTPTCQACRDAVAAAATVRKLKRRARQAA